eukprot:CAMPEP_0174714336 /NCGR_PEP_ID=MMETSP1094-20130205/17566_1 /TAXON_ID=156173 /ORGANISM="Chrysochromulina brevifilum, Strain UTEX LB 985" /LENGTH=285 /DNA_ID=CAMNT_0015913673 /DNA_START=52 /DNA_END=910 /DNA_ORIENTATION=+
MTTIADIQAKFVDKLAEKLPSRSSMNPRSIGKALSEFDTDNDGFLNFPEFMRSVERCGNALDRREAEFLFSFWDTCAGERAPCGKVEIKLAVNDLMGSLPDFQPAFNSGAHEIGRGSAGGNKSNAPSQSGGIFDGGSYAADARGDAMPPSHRGPSAPSVREPFSAEAPARPRGNQSSVQGGIFNQEPLAVENSARGDGNKSNKSSISGGIFGEEAPHALAPTKRYNSNASSVPVASLAEQQRDLQLELRRPALAMHVRLPMHARPALAIHAHHSKFLCAGEEAVP